MRETPPNPLLFGPDGYGKTAALRWTLIFREKLSLKNNYIQVGVSIDDFVMKRPDMRTLAPHVSFSAIMAMIIAYEPIPKFTFGSLLLAYVYPWNIFAPRL